MPDFQGRASRCCSTGLSECQNALEIVLRVGRCSEWFVEPGHQIRVSEQIYAQERDELGQAPAEAGGQLQAAQRQHRDQCCQNLGSDRVCRSADEGFDLQDLLERLEKQLDLLAILVDFGDGAGPVIDDDGVRREVHLMGGFDVRHLAIGDDAEARQVAIVVEQ